MPRGGEQLVGFLLEVALLARQPATEGLAVVVEDGLAHRQSAAPGLELMGVAVVDVDAATGAHQVVAGRQQGAAQGLAIHQIAEGGEHGIHIRAGLGDQGRHLGGEGRGDDVVGIEAEAPGGVDQPLAEVALLGEGVKRALHHLHARMGGQDLQRAVCAATVEHQDVLGPGQASETAGDICFLVESENQGGDLIEAGLHL